MDVEARHWGKPGLLDYVPFLGLIYRYYWWRVACSVDGEVWRAARRKELIRGVVPTSITAGSAFVWVGGTGYLGHGVLTALTGLMLYQLARPLSK